MAGDVAVAGDHRIGHGGLCEGCGDPYPCWWKRINERFGWRRQAPETAEIERGDVRGG